MSGASIGLVAIAKVRCVTKSRAKGVVPLHPREKGAQSSSLGLSYGVRLNESPTLGEGEG